MLVFIGGPDFHRTLKLCERRRYCDSNFPCLKHLICSCPWFSIGAFHLNKFILSPSSIPTSHSPTPSYRHVHGSKGSLEGTWKVHFCCIGGLCGPSNVLLCMSVGAFPRGLAGQGSPTMDMVPPSRKGETWVNSSIDISLELADSVCNVISHLEFLLLQLGLVLPSCLPWHDGLNHHSWGKQHALLIPESSCGRNVKKAPGEELKVGVDVAA